MESKTKKLSAANKRKRTGKSNGIVRSLLIEKIIKNEEVDKEVRLKIAQRLLTEKTTKVIESLLTHEDAAVRNNALYAIPQTVNGKKLLINVAKSGQEDTALHAIEILSQKADKAVQNSLLEIVCSSTSHAVRLAAFDAYCRIRKEGGMLSYLMEIVKSAEKNIISVREQISELESLNEKILELKGRMDILGSELTKTSELKVSELVDTKIGELENKYKEYRPLSTEIESLRNGHNVLVGTVNSLFADIKNLRTQILYSHEKPVQFDELQKRILALERWITEFETKFSTINQRLSAKERECAEIGEIAKKIEQSVTRRIDLKMSEYAPMEEVAITRKRSNLLAAIAISGLIGLSAASFIARKSLVNKMITLQNHYDTVIKSTDEKITDIRNYVGSIQQDLISERQERSIMYEKFEKLSSEIKEVKRSILRISAAVQKTKTDRTHVVNEINKLSHRLLRIEEKLFDPNDDLYDSLLDRMADELKDIKEKIEMFQSEIQKEKRR